VWADLLPGETGLVTGSDQGTVESLGQSDRRSSPWPLVAVWVGYFMVILDTMVVNVALPALSRGLHATTTGLQWVVVAYGLVFAALLLSAGALRTAAAPRRSFRQGWARSRWPRPAAG
jgi:hypothetical protein